MFNQKIDPKFLEALQQVIVPSAEAARAKGAEISESLARRYQQLKPITMGESAALRSQGVQSAIKAALAHKAGGAPHSVHITSEADQIHHTIEHGNKSVTHVYDFSHDPKTGKASLRHVQTITAHYESVSRGSGDEVIVEMSPFSKDYKSQLSSKPGEGAGFDSKKVSTGTVYVRKFKKDNKVTPTEVNGHSVHADVKEDAEHVAESSPFSKDYKSQLPSKPGEKAGFDSKKVSTGTVYKRQSANVVGEGVGQDTPGNSTHQCAIHVKHSTMGEGRTLFSQHAEPDASGHIAWYDVMFEEGIVKCVPTEELEIIVSESHMNHKTKK